ncbi:MAG: glycosyltransferase family 2 protein [Candidatus Omnitrophica bacterium]|nr:glycosyltransferase family 2 protein [Candidatus Omnitrophota bacterium]MBU1047348.1 glycosyltransferase family 2 protein [Candidatus Omnitrophota bacterium]MBU1630959.1 glycosyltransferase family 2 protein [Candidatus Omnitrophota bacterium]MBU1766612.1 glycosyltransferase family 2 protein [Candidatus Omnitrophota bacterium]MBU1889067.1 glycosyltransferase family 2 protein [Candidatus Omnitrophota bacterium]
MKQKISAIVPTYNEEDNIQDCLKNLDWVDELIVVDSFSTDNTVSIAQKYADKIIQHKYDYSARQKNWIIPQASHNWVILIDADERVNPQLRNEILQLLEKGPDKKAYWIYRTNIFMGKEIRHCGWEKDRVIRLFTKEHRYEDVRVHAEIQAGKEHMAMLSAKLVHYSYKNLDDYLIKLRRYSKWGAEKSFTAGKRANFFIICAAPLGMFLKRYIGKLGFLDGIHGLVLSLFASFSVLIKYIRLWELQTIENRKQKTVNRKNRISDF